MSPESSHFGLFMRKQSDVVHAALFGRKVIIRKTDSDTTSTLEILPLTTIVQVQVFKLKA
jgi:hypothetical protein